MSTRRLLFSVLILGLTCGLPAYAQMAPKSTGKAAATPPVAGESNGAASKTTKQSGELETVPLNRGGGAGTSKPDAEESTPSSKGGK